MLKSKSNLFKGIEGNRHLRCKKLNLTSQLISFSLCSTIAHVVIPIKGSCDALSFECAPRDKTV